MNRLKSIGLLLAALAMGMLGSSLIAMATHIAGTACRNDARHLATSCPLGSR
jgi:hypothetical protein